MSTSILGSLAVADPERAKRQILAAIAKAKGNRSEAATELGVEHRNLYRIIGRLEMWPEIDRLMEERGFKAWGGPPRKVDQEPPRRRRSGASST